MMKRLGLFALLCGFVNCGLCSDRAMTKAAAATHPYRSIVERNVFGLRPVHGIHTEVPAAPLPKVTLTGITTILRGKRALFRIQFPVRPGQPAKTETCILGEGQQDGPIRVMEIDEKTATVKLNNSGTVAVVTFEKPSPTPAPSAPRLNPYSPQFPVRSVTR
jgi:hypothetical protein